jgi:negative regulator of sigma E activity
MSKNEQISAMLDGELSEAELKAILADMDHENTQAWATYSAVGDFIRSSEMAAFHSPPLLDRIAASLNEEPTVVAPVIATHASRHTTLQKPAGVARARRLLASVAAIGFFSFALNQAIPPSDNQVQMVRTQPAQNQVSEADLALWQEYFMAHQQNSLRSGLSGVSPIARVEANRPSMDNTERVIVNNTDTAEWMNVWEPSAYSTDSSVKFNYVSSSR